MGYKKSAKDLAFDRERTRLQAEIGHLRDSVVQKEKTIRALADELRCERGKNEEKQEQIERFQELLDLDCNDIRPPMSPRPTIPTFIASVLQGFHGGIF